jgi:hypothetical protein
MILRAQLADVVRNVNTWNAAYNFGLTYHGNQHNAAAWGVGNCLFTARAVDSMTTEWQLVRFKLQPADSHVRSAWTKIGELFNHVGWIPFYESDVADPVFGGSGYVPMDEIPLPDENEWKETHQQKHLEEATTRSKLVKATLHAVGMSAQVEGPDAHLPQVEAQAWIDLCQRIEQHNAEVRRRAAVAGKTAEEAANEFFASINVSGSVVEKAPGEPPKPPEKGWDAVFDWFYTHIKIHRMTVSELAEKIGYSPSTVAHQKQQYDVEHGTSIRKSTKKHKKA